MASKNNNNFKQFRQFSAGAQTIVTQICHVTSSDILIVSEDAASPGQVVQMISIENETLSLKANFAVGGRDNSIHRSIKFVKSNGGDKVYIYDSEEVLYLWNPHTNQVVAKNIV